MSDNGSDVPDDVSFYPLDPPQFSSISTDSPPIFPKLNPYFQPAATYQQRVSTRSQLQNLPCLKNGYLDMKLANKFHLSKWKRYFFKLRGKKLFYADNPEADLFYEIDLSDVIIAESGNKNKSCSFEVRSFHPNFHPILSLSPLFTLILPHFTSILPPF